MEIKLDLIEELDFVIDNYKNVPTYIVMNTCSGSPVHRHLLKEGYKEEISYKYIIETYITYREFPILIKEKLLNFVDSYKQEI